MQAVDSA